MQELKDRVTRVEIDVEAIKVAVTGLDQDFRSLRDELRAIQKVLVQIKYFAMGAVALYAFDSHGLGSVISALFGGL